jgi:methionine synthase I (cobalamin-dependent)
MLHARWVSFEKCFDKNNLPKPAAVGDIHREYI